MGVKTGLPAVWPTEATAGQGAHARFLPFWPAEAGQGADNDIAPYPLTGVACWPCLKLFEYRYAVLGYFH